MVQHLRQSCVMYFKVAQPSTCMQMPMCIATSMPINRYAWVCLVTGTGLTCQCCWCGSAPLARRWNAAGATVAVSHHTLSQASCCNVAVQRHLEARRSLCLPLNAVPFAAFASLGGCRGFMIERCLGGWCRSHLTISCCACLGCTKRLRQDILLFWSFIMEVLLW